MPVISRKSSTTDYLLRKYIDSDIPPVSLDSNRHLLVEYYASCIRLTGPSRPEVSSAESFVK